MSYHNHRVCFRLTAKEGLMTGRLIAALRTKNVTGLMRLALGVLSRLARDDVPVYEQEDWLETWTSRQFVEALLERIRSQERASMKVAAPPAEMSDNSSSKRQTKSRGSKRAPAVTT
jgi:hypothetical protein